MVLLKEIAFNPFIFLAHTVLNTILIWSVADLNDMRIFVMLNMFLYGMGLTAQRFTIDLAADTVSKALEALRECNKLLGLVNENTKK